MNRPVFHFSRFVRLVGGRREAAKRLGISPGMVGHIENGRRGISIEVAKTVAADSGGAISLSDLRPDIWPAAAEAEHDPDAGRIAPPLETC